MRPRQKPVREPKRSVLGGFQGNLLGEHDVAGGRLPAGAKHQPFLGSPLRRSRRRSKFYPRLMYAVALPTVATDDVEIAFSLELLALCRRKPGSQQALGADAVFATVSLIQLADFAIARPPTGKSSFELEKERHHVTFSLPRAWGRTASPQVWDRTTGPA